MLKHLKGARVMQDCSSGQMFVDTGTQCLPMGASSWNDLKDKPFYVEEVDVTILPPMEMDFTRFSEETAYEGDNGHIATPFVCGKHYAVIVDGIGYDCVGCEDEYGQVYLGNYDHPDNFNSDMPFYIYSHADADGDWCTRYQLKKGTVHTIAITVKGEAVHTIDPKYIKDMYYVGEGEVELCREVPVPFHVNMSSNFVVVGGLQPFVLGQEYKVYLDGDCYDCTTFVGVDGKVCIGNPAFESVGEDNGLPFAFSSEYYDEVGSEILVFNTGSGGTEKTYLVTITTIGEAVHTIDPKYMPKPDMVITSAVGVSGTITTNDVTITSGTVVEVFEKIWAGEPVDIRVRGCYADGSYMAEANEVRAIATFYGGSLLVKWIVLSTFGDSIKAKFISFTEDGTINRVDNYKNGVEE